jgi:hypothetical protein
MESKTAQPRTPDIQTVLGNFYPKFAAKPNFYPNFGLGLKKAAFFQMNLNVAEMSL